MGLDVGEPNELTLLATGKTVEGRDSFGLLMDPEKYASRKCSDCYGRGVLYKIHPLTKEQVDLHLKQRPEDEMYIQQSKPGVYYTRAATKCPCVQRRYDKVRIQFADALVKAGLAVKNLATKRYELV